MRTIRQIIGNFEAGQELMEELPLVSSFENFGIQLKEGEIIVIDGREIEMGKTGRLQYKDTAIHSVQLLRNNFLIIDCTFEYEEDFG